MPFFVFKQTEVLEQAMKRGCIYANESNQKTQSAQEKSPERQVSESNPFPGQPEATQGPAFVPYKVNGKTICSEAEEYQKGLQGFNQRWKMYQLSLQRQGIFIESPEANYSRMLADGNN